MTWILCSGIFAISATTVRITCGAWNVPQIDSSPHLVEQTHSQVPATVAWMIEDSISLIVILPS